MVPGAGLRPQKTGLQPAGMLTYYFRGKQKREHVREHWRANISAARTLSPKPFN